VPAQNGPNMNCSNFNTYQTGNGANAVQDFFPFPRDATLTPVGGGNTEVGTTGPTQAAKDAYWSDHHGANWPAELTTRYSAYLRELGLNGTTTWRVGSEPHAPVCNSPANSSGKRRLISVAVVNCTANNVHGNAVANVKSNSYANFFITESSTGSNGDLYAEFVEMITPTSGSGGKLHQVVQLYR
jgi:hypothetical protein